jgi:hypothetical protein
LADYVEHTERHGDLRFRAGAAKESEKAWLAG